MKILVSLIVACIASVSFAKSAEECKAAAIASRTILSSNARKQVVDVLNSSVKETDMIKQVTELLNGEECVVAIIQSNDGQSVRGIAQSLVENMLSLPEELRNEGNVDGMIGNMIFEN